MKAKLLLARMLLIAFGFCAWLPTTGFAQAGGQQIRTSRAGMRIAGVAYSFGFTKITSGSNEVAIDITVLDGQGAAVPYAEFDTWLSDASTGLGVSVTTASGSSGVWQDASNLSGLSNGACVTASNTGITAPNSKGACLGTYVTKNSYRVQANSAGIVRWEIVDSAKTQWYICAASPYNAGTTPSCVRILTANYGFLWDAPTPSEFLAYLAPYDSRLKNLIPFDIRRAFVLRS